MVNNVSPAAGEAVPKSDIRRWLRLYRGLTALGRECGPMPDEAMDHIIEAADIVAHAIVSAPALNEQDVADKFRLVAELVDDEAGSMALERAAVDDANAALTYLNARRDAGMELIHDRIRRARHD